MFTNFRFVIGRVKNRYRLLAVLEQNLILWQCKVHAVWDNFSCQTVWEKLNCLDIRRYDVVGVFQVRRPVSR